MLFRVLAIKPDLKAYKDAINITIYVRFLKTKNNKFVILICNLLQGILKFIWFKIEYLNKVIKILNLWRCLSLYNFRFQEAWVWIRYKANKTHLKKPFTKFNVVILIYFFLFIHKLFILFVIKLCFLIYRIRHKTK